MEAGEDIDERLKQSLRILRAWRWMSGISSSPQEVAALLTAEARALIDLGRAHPGRAKEIGQLIVAYHRLIKRMKTLAELEHAPSAELATV